MLLGCFSCLNFTTGGFFFFSFISIVSLVDGFVPFYFRLSLLIDLYVYCVFFEARLGFRKEF
jgi:hypothetical protein